MEHGITTRLQSVQLRYCRLVHRRSFEQVSGSPIGEVTELLLLTSVPITYSTSWRHRPCIRFWRRLWHSEPTGIPSNAFSDPPSVFETDVRAHATGFPTSNAIWDVDGGDIMPVEVIPESILVARPGWCKPFGLNWRIPFLGSRENARRNWNHWTRVWRNKHRHANNSWCLL